MSSLIASPKWTLWSLSSVSLHFLKWEIDLLVIFLCLGILSACKTAFNDKVTGIVGGLIAILIIIKVSKGLSKLGL